MTRLPVASDARKSRTRHQSKEGERPVVAKEGEDGDRDAVAVGKRVELGLAVAGAGTVDDGHLFDAEVVDERLDRELGLDLEPLRNEGRLLQQATRQRAVAGEKVEGADTEQEAHDADEGAVAPRMADRKGARARPLQARADDHVGAGLNPGNQQGSALGRIGAIAIDHEEDVCRSRVAQAREQRESFALARLTHDFGAGGMGNFARTIGRTVVDDHDARPRQRGAKVGHDLRNGVGFVEGRHHDCDSRLTHTFSFLVIRKRSR